MDEMNGTDMIIISGQKSVSVKYGMIQIGRSSWKKNDRKSTKEEKKKRKRMRKRGREKER